MIIFEKIVLNSLCYTGIGAGYLLVLMITFSPRVWDYQDYPKKIKEKIPPQTQKERFISGLVGIPWFLFILTFPLISTAYMETALGGEIPFEIAFFNMFFMVFLFFLVDLVILDWLIICKITPKFVIINGTIPEDYKDFSHHYKGHFMASIPLILICIIFSAIIAYF